VIALKPAERFARAGTVVPFLFVDELKSGVADNNVETRWGASPRAD